MQIIVILLFFSIFSLDYLADIAKVIDSKFTLVPELLSGITLLIVLGNFIRSKILILDIKYIVLFAILGIHIINGIITNGFSAGSILAGSRVYFKYVPFFLLASVYTFSDIQIKQQLKILLFLFALQLPIALLQKFVIFADLSSGDHIRGTFATSSFLTIALVCVISMAVAFYFKNKISFSKLVGIVFIMFIPTTINETKSTLILLPVAILVPVIFLKLQGELKQGIFKLFVVVSLLFVSFVTIYDSFWGDRYGEGGSIIDFYTDKNRVTKYLAPKTSGAVPHDDFELGRIDRMIAPIETLNKKGAVDVIIGLGMGSVTKTPFDELTGESIHYWEQGMVGNSISYLLWEVGILGVILSFFLMFLIFRDAQKLSFGNNLENAIATGWLGVVVIFFLSLFYKDLIPINPLMYLFWYFSGYIAAKSLMQKRFRKL